MGQWRFATITTIITIAAITTIITTLIDFINKFSGKSPHAPSCENPRHFPSQFYFKISEYVVNIYEISVGFTFYVEQISVNLHKFVYGMLCSQTNKQTTGSMESLFLPVYKHHKTFTL